MRFFITNVLATALLVAFTATSASAISLTLGGANGQTVAVGGQVSISVTLDTEGATGIA